MNELFAGGNHTAEISRPDNLPISPGKVFKPELENSTNGKRFVVFYVNQQPFAIAAEMIAEITRPLPVASLPNSPEWLTGIANLRGEIISVIDFAGIMQQTALGFSSKTKFLVLQTNDAEHAMIAFPIDRPGEILFVPVDSLEPTPTSTVSFVYGQIAYQAGALQLIDAAKMMSSLTIG